MPSRCAALVLVLVCPAVAQETAPTKWLLEAIYPGPGSALHEQRGQLAALHERFAAKGLAIRLQVPVDYIDRHRESNPPYQVELASRLLLEPQLDLLIDGAVVWSADGIDGLLDVLEALTAEPKRQEKFEYLSALRTHVVFYLTDGPAIPEMTARLVDTAPSWGLARGWRYVDDVWNRADRTVARHDARQAILALTPHPHSLTVFCDMALRADPFERQTAALVEKAMAQVAESDRDAVWSWLVWLRAKLRIDASAVTTAIIGNRLPLLADSPLKLDLAEVLAGAPEPSRFADLAERLLVGAWHHGVRQDHYRLTRCKVLRRCLADDEAFATQLDEWVGDDKNSYRLNTLAWDLLTKPETMGKFDVVALELMERVRRTAGDRMSDSLFDTLALAFYSTGQPAEAVTLETRCIEDGDGDPRYLVRRQRFDQAVKLLRAR